MHAVITTSTSFRTTHFPYVSTCNKSTYYSHSEQQGLEDILYVSLMITDTYKVTFDVRLSNKKHHHEITYIDGMSFQTNFLKDKKAFIDSISDKCFYCGKNVLVECNNEIIGNNIRFNKNITCYKCLQYLHNGIYNKANHDIAIKYSGL